MRDDPFDDPFFDDAQEDMQSGFRTAIAAQVAGIAVVAGSALVGAYLAWGYAPPVGGEWWPYIRAVVAIVGAGVGAGVGSVLSTIVVAIAMWVIGGRWFA